MRTPNSLVWIISYQFSSYCYRKHLQTLIRVCAQSSAYYNGTVLDRVIPATCSSTVYNNIPDHANLISSVSDSLLNYVYLFAVKLPVLATTYIQPYIYDVTMQLT